MAMHTQIDPTGEHGIEIRNVPNLEHPRFVGVVTYTILPRRTRNPERGYRAQVLCTGGVRATNEEGWFAPVHEGVYAGDLIIPDNETLYDNPRYLVNFRKLEGDELSIYGRGPIANLRRKAEHNGGRWKPVAVPA